jgi:hypothetical protein
MFEDDASEHRADKRDRSAEPRHEPRPNAEAAPGPRQHGPKHPHPKPSVRLKTDGRHFFFAPGSLSH